MRNIVLGYLLSFLYMLSVIVVGELIQKKFNTDKERTRKAEHIATSASWALCYLFVGPSYHLVIVNFLALLGLAFLTFSGLMKSVERRDTARSYGLLYFGLSTFLNILIAILVDVKLVPITAVAYYCLALADGFAPIVASAFNKRNVTVFEPKTLVGFFTVFIISSLVALFCSMIFGLSYSPLLIVSVGSLAAHTELYGKRGLDNLTLPFSVFGYLTLHHYGLVSTSAEVALTVLTLFTLLAALSGSLTYAGGAVSFCYILLCAVFAPVSLCTMIFALFFIEAVISKITGRLSKKTEDTHGSKKGRGGYQIFANTAASLIFVTVYFITKNPVFFIAASVAVAEEFADSVASGIGRLSKKAPLDIIRLKPTVAGISGGVSLLGIFAAILGSFAAASVLFTFGDVSLTGFLIISAIAFFGTVIDSILGSLLQVLFRCPACDSLTESKAHCGAEAVKIKGISFIDNSTVNLLSGFITAIVSVFIPIV